MQMAGAVDASAFGVDVNNAGGPVAELGWQRSVKQGDAVGKARIEYRSNRAVDIGHHDAINPVLDLSIDSADVKAALF
jgi:hypothetical protein